MLGLGRLSGRWGSLSQLPTSVLRCTALQHTLTPRAVEEKTGPWGGKVEGARVVASEKLWRKKFVLTRFYDELEKG